MNQLGYKTNEENTKGDLKLFGSTDQVKTLKSGSSVKKGMNGKDQNNS